MDPGLIDWRCHTCLSPVEQGAIHIDLGAVRRSERACAGRQRQPDEPDLSPVWPVGILLAPREAQWRVDCDACCRAADHDCADCFSIDIRKCRTAYALLRWTMHLYGKSWFGVTNWVHFAAAAARRSGPVSESTGVW